MRIPYLATAAAFLLASGLPFDASATNYVTKWANRNPAGACTLSVPTTDTGTRPRASGFRNEGTVSNFVICSYDVISSDFEVGVDGIGINLASIDGKAHSVSCTGVDREAATFQADYATYNVNIPAGGVGELDFSTFDFPNLHLQAWNISVTCNLVPGTSVLTVQSHYGDNVGS
jgi:hypothetical protein